MPNGPVHSKASIILGIAAVPALYYLGMSFEQIALFSSGVALSLIVNPDLDQGDKHHTAPTKNFRKIGGRWGEKLWWLFWYPYARAVPHRDWKSHMPIVGTLLRVGYFILPIWLLSLYFDWSFGIPTILAWVLGGLIVSDTLHWILDNTVHSKKEHHH